MSKTLETAIELISKASITPDDAGCQTLLADRLSKIGFHIEKMPFEEVDNLWARRNSAPPLFVFAGHTDVVPTGPLEKWQSPPFQPEVRDGQLYGRGSADMKGSIAAMLVACENFIAEHPNHSGSIAFLITSDEEGPAKNGTVKVVETLEKRKETMNWCLIGEPSSKDKIADVIKNGRRGSINAKLKIIGKQGHVAYPHLANNPLHAFLPIMDELVNKVWDKGNEFFPPTTFQIANFNMGTGSENVIPESLDLQFNLRFSTALTDKKIKKQVAEILDKGDFEYEITWRLSGNPFITPVGDLVDIAQTCIQEVCDDIPELSTSGGTSDGRFIAPTGAQVLELGPLNKTIHQINECVGVDDLEKLTQIYQKMLEALLPD